MQFRSWLKTISKPSNLFIDKCYILGWVSGFLEFVICFLNTVLLITNNKFCLDVRISQFQCDLHHSFVEVACDILTISLFF